MSYKYMLLDSRGAPVAQGISEDGPEKNVWQLRIARGDIKRVLGHEYISLVGTSEQFPAMEGRIVQCRDDLISVESVRMLGEEVRRNLRMPVRFESFLYPVSGRWHGRMPVLSNDLSCGGVAFFCARKLEVNEVAEIVIPVTAEPLVLRVKILRERPSPEPIPLYSAGFVDMLREEENMICEAVFNLQFRYTAEM
ncbi:MAG: PilZ domain-containing protein [Clostridiales bacterium]|nr:PilZ domain-containing protein [Clostridiales bacterium]